MKGIASGARKPPAVSTSPRTRELFEYSESKPERVDKDAGIIYGVKLLGQISRNTHNVRGVDETRYTDSALREAAPLYEGLPVNYDHAPKSERGEARRTSAPGGIVQGVQFKPGQGLIGNIKLLKTHERAAPLMEAAASPEMSHLFACSHHAYGRSSIQGRTLVVDKIPDPRSVDIVTAGGTVRSLFEGRSTMNTVKEILEGLAEKIDEAKRPKLRKLLEADILPEGAEMDDAAASDDPDEQMAAAFKAAACAVIDDDSLDMKAKLAKLKEILSAQEKLMGGGDDEEDEGDDEEEPGTETKESLRELASKHKGVRKLLESFDTLKTRVRESGRKTKNRKLLESAKLPDKALSKVFVQLIEDARDEGEVKRLIEDRRLAFSVGRPKSAAAGLGGQLGGGSATDRESLAAFSRQIRGY